jgi:hypothetical protein
MVTGRGRDGHGHKILASLFILTKMSQFEDTQLKNWLEKSLIKRFFT